MKKCPYCAEEIRDEAILCRCCPLHQKAVALPLIGFAAIPVLLIAVNWSNVWKPAQSPERISPVKFNMSSAVTFPHDRRQTLGREFTLECWYRVDGPGSSEWIGLITKSAPERNPTQGYSLRLCWQPGRRCPGRVVFTFYGADVELSRDYNSELGAWNHVAIAADSYNGALKMFLNGKYLRHLDGKALPHADVPKLTKKVPKQPSVPIVIGGEGERFRVLNGAIFDVRISNVDRLHTAFVPQHIDRFDGRTVFLARLREGKGSRTEEEVSGVSVPFAGLWDEKGPTTGPGYAY